MEQTNQSAMVEQPAAITEPQATIKIEGQEFPLEAALARDDSLLKTILQPHFSSIENANITREVKNGKLFVTIVKKAQHKGGRKSRKNDLCEPTPFEVLCESVEQINPAILLAEELMRKDIKDVFDIEDLERAEEVLIVSREEIGRVEMQFTALVKTPAEAGSQIPVGF